MERLRPVRTRLRLFVVSLTPLIRVVEGVLAVVCLVGVAVSGFAAYYLYAIPDGVLNDQLELFGWYFMRSTVWQWVAMFSLGFIWFAGGAIRGGSTPTEASEHGTARQGRRA
jgi:uncharacterized membrane protein